MKENKKEFYQLMHPLMFTSFCVRHPDTLKDMIHLFFDDLAISKIVPYKSLPEYLGIAEDESEIPEVDAGEEGREYLIEEILAPRKGIAEVRLMRVIETENECEECDCEMIDCLFTTAPFNNHENALSRFEVVDLLNGYDRFVNSPRVLAVYVNGKEEMLNAEQKDFLKYLREGTDDENSTDFVKAVHKKVKAINENEWWRILAEPTGKTA